MADPGWGIWVKCPPFPPHLVEELAHILLIETDTKLCQAKISFAIKTHENMHILVASIIANSPETKANQSQTSCEIVTQHLCVY